jgi:serine/threonine-protein kinase
LSIPLAAKRPDDTSPALRGASGFVCPKCHKRYEEGTTPARCTVDSAQLIRVADMVDADGDPMLGRTLDGRFTVLAKLGAGSMGTVYRARQHAMGREVAIKILRSDRAIDAASKGRFMREARANSVLTSPHTVTVFDFGQSESGELYLAMELLEGESLGQRLKRQTRLSIDASIELARQALRSLAEAHAKGIIHRDLKPDNLFFARQANGGQFEETVKVVDFGIAKLVRDDDEQMNAVETQAGTVFGTPRYMSPEQAQGKPLDSRSDLYSLGVILYHCLTGRPPFTDDDAIVVMARHIKTMPKPPSEVCPEAQIPAELEAVVMRALGKEPSQRPESADAMVQELSRARELGGAVTSGVRINVGGAVARALEKTPVLPTPPIAFRTSQPDESLTSAAAGVPRRNGVVIGALIGGGALFVALVAAVVFLATRPDAPPAADVRPPTTSTSTAPPKASATFPAPPLSSTLAPISADPPAIDPLSLPLVPGPKSTTTAGNKPPPRSGPGVAPPGPTTKPTATPPPAPTKYEKFD